MKAQTLEGRTVILKLKTTKFHNFTRSKSLGKAFNDSDTMLQARVILSVGSGFFEISRTFGDFGFDATRLKSML